MIPACPSGPTPAGRECTAAADQHWPSVLSDLRCHFDRDRSDRPGTMTTATPTAGRQRGGRQKRLERKTRSAAPGPAYLTRKIPVYALLEEEQLVRIEQAADRILAEVGMDIRGDPDALALFRQAGADVEGERVRFEPGLAASLCRSAPSRFTQHARNPGRSVEIGGDHIVFAPAYGSPFVHDRAGGRRYGTLADFENFVKLAYLSPAL